MREVMHVDPALILAWLRGRSIARSLPQPVADRGGWRVDTGSATERCRFVFAAPALGFQELVTENYDPRVCVRLCVDNPTMRRLLPDRWDVQPASYVMVNPTAVAARQVPKDYTASVAEVQGAIEARISTAIGDLAASGYAAETDRVFVYDRIVTSLEHQRRGLGSAVMALLGAQRKSSRSQQLLVATAAGRALYTTLGWRDHAPYASAFIRDRAA